MAQYERHDEESIYFNAYLVKPTASTANNNQTNAIYRMNTPIVPGNTKDWRLGLASLSVYDQYIPKLYFNSGTWSVGILYNNVTLYEAKCNYVSSSSVVGTDNPIFQYGQICDMVTNTFATVIAALNLAHVGTVTQNVSLWFDESDQMFKLLCGTEFDTSATIQLVVNRPLYAILFHAFNSFINFNITFASSGIPNDYLNQIICEPDVNNRVTCATGYPDSIVHDPAGVYRFLTQKYATPQTVNQIAFIRVLMNQTLIRPEYFSSSQESFLSGNTTQNLANTKILMDLITNTDSYVSGKLVYFPTIISYHSLENADQLNTFDIEIRTVDVQNVERPLSLPYGYMASVKIEFRRITKYYEPNPVKNVNLDLDHRMRKTGI